MSPTPPPLPSDGPLRPHTYDGIEEFDHRLPNWWLFTLYGAIVFSVLYWILGFQMELAATPEETLRETMRENQLAAARNSGEVSDPVLWKLSRETQTVEAGRATFAALCASCHQPDLGGGIGPNLKDTVWIHGGQPIQIHALITRGVLEKGMPTWGPVLGQNKITEVTAFILSHHPAP
jgi:cytochrome c oxidase cbb3-type subunit 3